MASGSGTRQRGVSISARFNDDEAALVRAAADRAGVTVASYIRMSLLAEPKIRATRRPPVSAALLSRLIHDLGPVADSLRQIAAHVPAEDEPRLAAALDQLADMAFLCLQAMGRAPRRSRSPPLPEPLTAIWARAAADSRPVPLPLLAFARVAPR